MKETDEHQAALGTGADLGPGDLYPWRGEGPRPPFPSKGRHATTTWEDEGEWCVRWRYSPGGQWSDWTIGGNEIVPFLATDVQKRMVKIRG